jgi:hypothetical protein
MTPRMICMMAVFALGLLANTTFALWLSAEIRFWKTSLAFESVSSNGSHAYALKFGYGYVDLDFVSFGPDGEIHSFHVHY